jgi:hypothetical protein
MLIDTRTLDDVIGRAVEAGVARIRAGSMRGMVSFCGVQAA